MKMKFKVHEKVQTIKYAIKHTLLQLKFQYITYAIEIEVIIFILQKSATIQSGKITENQAMISIQRDPKHLMKQALLINRGLTMSLDGQIMTDEYLKAVQEFKFEESKI